MYTQSFSILFYLSLGDSPRQNFDQHCERRIDAAYAGLGGRAPFAATFTASSPLRPLSPPTSPSPFQPSLLPPQPPPPRSTLPAGLVYIWEPATSEKLAASPFRLMLSMRGVAWRGFVVCSCVVVVVANFIPHTALASQPRATAERLQRHLVQISIV